MQRIKVLYIITRMDKGGSAQNTLATALRLDKEKFEVTLISGLPEDPDGQMRHALTLNTIQYEIIPELVRNITPLKDIKAFLKIVKHIVQSRYDIVHTHTSKAGILGRWAAKAAGVKIIIHTPHGHIFYGYFGGFLTGLFILLERLTAVITDKIITLTKKGKEDHVNSKIAKADKFMAIYSGIDVKYYADYIVNKGEEKKKRGISEETLVIGTVTRLDPIKGNAYLVAALPVIIREFPAVRLVIIGDGRERAKLEENAKIAGVGGKIIFVGVVDDIRPLVSTFDIFVLPSLNEGMGRCLLEAQAMGVPVIATNVGGIPEVVKDGESGFLVPPRDSQALAEAILRMLKDEGLRLRMGSQAKQSVDERFSIEEMVRQIELLYEKLLLSKR